MEIRLAATAMNRPRGGFLFNHVPYFSGELKLNKGRVTGKKERNVLSD